MNDAKFDINGITRGGGKQRAIGKSQVGSEPRAIGK